MPPKSTSAKGRKSTSGASKPLSKPASRASKPASRSVQVTVGSSDDENAAPTRRSKRDQTSEDEEENDELKSNPSDSDEVAEELTSGSAKKRKTNAANARKSKSTTASPPKKSTSARQSLKGPSSSSKAIKTGSKPSSKAAASTTASQKTKAKKATTSKKSAAAEKAGSKRKRTTTTTSDDEGSDDESVPTTRSRSSRGYTWEAEIINIDPEKIMADLTYHNSIKTDIDADYDHLPGEEKVKFRRDQIIYLLPDPSSLPGRSDEIGPEELPDDEFWCARILDCCALDQGEDQSPLGLLRVAWFYSPDQAQALEVIHPDWKKKLRQHRWDEHEMIASDHLDFVGVDSFCGFPEGRIEYSTMIQGLIVDDVERMKKPAMREASNRIKRVVGLPYNGDKDGKNVEHYLEKLTKETPAEREKRKAKDAKREAKEKAAKRRASQRQEVSEVEEATDDE